MRAISSTRHDHNNSMKRGEKEAISLKRRRLIKNTIRAFSVTGICLAVITSIYLWRDGTIDNWIYSAETKVEGGLVNAGLIVEELRISGQRQTKIAEIEDAIKVKQGVSLFALDMKEIKKQVEQLRWVKTAIITRKLPEALIINIREHEPTALWQVDNKLWVLSDEGIKITDENLEDFSLLPMISGAGADKALEGLINVVSNNSQLFDRVETATWVGGRRWDLILQNGIKIMLPEVNVSEAWNKLVTLEQKEQLLARNILAVDLRVQDKTVVRLTPEEAERRRLMAKTSGQGEEI